MASNAATKPKKRSQSFLAKASRGRNARRGNPARHYDAATTRALRITRRMHGVTAGGEVIFKKGCLCLSRGLVAEGALCPSHGTPVGKGPERKRA